MLKPKHNTLQTYQVPAPIGGINAKNSYADMAPTDAIYLENFFPTTGGCKVRGGTRKWASIPVGPTGTKVNTLMVWNSPTTDIPASMNQKLLAAYGANIYDVTTRNAAPTGLVVGLTSDKWQWVNYVNSAGTFLYAVNGSDQPVVYTTGATITRPQDAAGPTQITGVGLTSVTKFINICIHQQRLWFVEKDSTRAWYLATNAIYGTATLFDFGYLFSKGGHLKALMTWTIDAGKGSDDHLVAISSKGEAVVYAGTDPSLAASWKLVGVFYIGAPVGYRCGEKMDGDLAIITQFGLVPFSQALQSTQTNAQSLSFTDKIQLLISQLISDTYYTFGWQGLVLPKYNMFILNVPLTDGSVANYVMNTTTMSWCLFTNINSNCIVNYYDDLYFAKDNIVYQGFTGVLDDVELNDSGGTPILARSQQAYSYLDNPGLVKHCQFMRPLIFTDIQTSYSAKVLGDYDFIDQTFLASATVAGTGYAWDTILWDTHLWGSSSVVLKNLLGTNALGFALSPAVVISSRSTTNWIATSLLYEEGGLIG